jgi:hypothetical protein
VNDTIRLFLDLLPEELFRRKSSPVFADAAVPGTSASRGEVRLQAGLSGDAEFKP